MLEFFNWEKKFLTEDKGIIKYINPKSKKKTERLNEKEIKNLHIEIEAFTKDGKMASVQKDFFSSKKRKISFLSSKGSLPKGIKECTKNLKLEEQGFFSLSTIYQDNDNIVGYPYLKELVYFKIKLLQINYLKKRNKELDQFINLANSQKEKGNKLYKNKEYENASKYYMKGIRSLAHIPKSLRDKYDGLVVIRTANFNIHKNQLMEKIYKDFYKKPSVSFLESKSISSSGSKSDMEKEKKIDLFDLINNHKDGEEKKIVDLVIEEKNKKKKLKEKVDLDLFKQDKEKLFKKKEKKNPSSSNKEKKITKKDFSSNKISSSSKKELKITSHQKKNQEIEKKILSPKEIEKKKFYKVLIDLVNNYCITMIKLNKMYESLQICVQAWEIGKNNQKLIYRMAKSLEGMEEFELASFFYREINQCHKVKLMDKKKNKYFYQLNKKFYLALKEKNKE